MNRNASIHTVNRLPKYLQCLNELKSKGVERVSSTEIAELIGTTASQVRQDFSVFGSYGAQGYGYNIDLLSTELRQIMGIDRPHRVAIVGVGGIGRALLEHMEFEKYGYSVVAGFDVDDTLIGKRVNGVQIYSVKDIAQVLDENAVDICILTVSQSAAKEVAQHLAQVGVPAIWNFTNEKLDLPKETVVQNINFQDSLFVLTYYLEHNSNAEETSA